MYVRVYGAKEALIVHSIRISTTMIELQKVQHSGLILRSTVELYFGVLLLLEKMSLRMAIR